MIDEVFEKSTAQLIKFAAVVCFLGFFYIQAFLTW
jgi:hypothetical protein